VAEIIKIIKEVTMKECDAPEVFHDMLAYHAVSATLGMFFKPRTLKIKRPNVFFLLACIPARGRRSTILDMHSTLVDTSLYHFYSNVREMKKDEAWKLVYLSEIQSGTEAGICDAIVEAVNLGALSYRICSPEYGHVLKKITKENDPTAGLDGLLCELYSGEKHTQRLSRLSSKGKDNSRIIPKGMYVTMFSGMQEPLKYLNKELSDSGFIRRLKVGYVKHTDFKMSDWKSPVEDEIDKTYSFDSLNKLRDIACEYIFPKMKKYNEFVTRLNVGPENLFSEEKLLNVYFAKGATKKISDLSRQWDEVVINDSSIYNIYQQTQWEYVSKLAMLKAIAEDKWKDGTTGKEHIEGMLFVEECDVDEAIRVIKSIDKNSEEMMNMMDVTVGKRETLTILDRIERKIKEAGPNGLLHSKLLTSTAGYTSVELIAFVNTLQEKEVIDKVTPDQARGRQATFYVHRTYRDMRED